MDYELYIIVLSSISCGLVRCRWFALCLSDFAYCSAVGSLFVVVSLLVV